MEYTSVEKSPTLEQIEPRDDDSQEALLETIANVPHVDEEQKEKLLKLPVGRVKTLVKMDPSVNMVNQEALFLITKSTELFIDSVAKEAYRFTVQAKKKTIQKKDLDGAIDNIDALAFLEGMLG